MFMIRVLLVDDNPVFREAFKQNLCERFPSMVVEEAGGGDEALKMIKKTPPDLIFTDIRMPGMNGLQLTRKIKGDKPNTPIAILTAYDLLEYREAALQHGADRYFVKTSLQWDEVAAFAKSIPIEGEF
jgi:YesN/AraC family two-component response regulator